MDIRLRLSAVRLLERMAARPAYARDIGLSDRSTFRGREIPSHPVPDKETKD